MTTEERVKRVETSFKQLIEYVNKYIEKPRRDLLIDMFVIFKKRMVLEPASAKTMYHSAYEGGWLYHTVNVIRLALAEAELWESNGANINFTKEEIVMAAIGHDFDKLGDDDESYYVPQTSDWHRKRGMVYDFNVNINYMKVPERALFLFQKHGIVLTLNETLGIKLADGLYDDANKAYFINYREGGRLKTNLPYILHHADLLASTLEHEEDLSIGK